MGVYDRQIASAKRIIAAKGQAVIWRQRSAVGGTAAKPGSGSLVEKTVKIAFLPPQLEYLGTFQSVIPGTDVAGGYLLGYMGQVDFEPGLEDTVLRGSEELGLTDKNGIEKIDPNGEGTILYILRFTR